MCRESQQIEAQAASLNDLIDAVAIKPIEPICNSLGKPFDLVLPVNAPHISGIQWHPHDNGLNGSQWDENTMAAVATTLEISCNSATRMWEEYVHIVWLQSWYAQDVMS